MARLYVGFNFTRVKWTAKMLGESNIAGGLNAMCEAITNAEDAKRARLEAAAGNGIAISEQETLTLNGEELTDDERINLVARDILERYKDAFLELAK